MSIFELKKVVLDSNVSTDVPEADPKVTKQEFAYVEEKENPRCGNCNMYILGGKCTLVKGEIDPDDAVCMYWAFRRSQPLLDKDYKPHLTKQQSNYIEVKGGSRCGTCKFRKGNDGCMMVEGKINMETGCCLAYEKGDD